MRPVVLIPGVVVVLLVAGAGLFGGYAWQRVNEPYKGFDGPEQFVDIPPGTGTAEIGRRLIAAGVVRDELAFRASVWITGQERQLRAGEYRFDRPLPARDVIAKLARGDVHVRRITFPEGLSIGEMALLFESRGFGSAREFVEAARDTAPIRDLDPEAPDLEGYLFPSTYPLRRGDSAARLVRTMADQFLATYNDELRRSAESQGLTTRAAVTLASLVEKETGKPEERPLVAAVYRNRMRRGMPMQADPTVVYALQKAGRYNGNIRRQDLALDSPYNTYKYPGLPPGPIASPGKASLEAAIRPADAPYLYFVSRNDGSHVFATTLVEHNRNVHEFQVLYFRQRRPGVQNGQARTPAQGQGAGGRSR